MIALLAAYTKTNRVIGAQGKIPWKLNSERRRFKEICNGKKVIMGRKSFEEIDHALSYCTIVIISRTDFIPPEGCLSGKLFIKEDRMHVALSDGTVLEDELLIAGGGEIYRQALPYTDIIYATEIEAEFKGNLIQHANKLDKKNYKIII